ncbi:SusC/RagA family TonB-linked outer membrane protein [Sphingobacterium sp. SGG-5]|nr:SusC/RagA family TonB-linked outer membrane protein [Sphingobacterium sp. SGG-5]
MKNYIIQFGNARRFPWSRSLVIMKLITLIILIASLQVHSKTNAQSINLVRQKITLVDVFRELKKQSSYTILCNSDLLNSVPNLRVNLKQKTLREALDVILPPLGLTYQIEDKTVVVYEITPSKKTHRPSTTPSNAVQQTQVSGKVVDKNNTPLYGVSISEKGGSVLTTTNADGEYTVNVSNRDVELVFRALGFQSITIAVKNRRTIQIVLQEDVQELHEVVVTALGIKREEKALGYAITKIDSTQLTDAPSGNWLDALSGKVPGLNMIRSNGGPTGSNKVILRGENNLTGENEALIVVDGVVLNTSSGRRTATGGDAAGPTDGVQPTDFGSGINDLNPEDIESVTVLRGPGASALYGQRGANGAIIVTTKSGSSKRKTTIPSITYTSNLSFEEANRWPDLQYEYGQGLNGAATYTYGTNSGTSLTWGPRFNGQSFIQYDPETQKAGTEPTAWIPYTNQIRDFFETGQTFTNSLSINGNVKNTNYRLSATHGKNSWIIPNTGYERTHISLSANSKVTSKLDVSVKANYTNKFSNNLPGMGYGNQSVMYWYVFWVPNGDINWLRNYWVKDKEYEELHDIFTTAPENPYAISYEFINGSNRNGITGNVQANYAFSKEWNLQLRATLDKSNDDRHQKRPWTAARLPLGSYRTQDINIREISGDFLLRYDKQINEDIRVTASIGGSMLSNRYYKDEKRADGLTEPNVYSFDNAAYDLVVIPDTARFNINSLYGLFSAGYKDYLYLDITSRQDWSSILATPTRKDNVGFFYPSASLSFVASDYFKMPEAFNLAKLRLSLSQTGSGGTTPYLTAYAYPLAANGIYPDGSLQNPTILPNPDLKPLKTTTFEIGTDIRMFKNRLGLDIAWYSGNTKNQILNRIIDRSSGYTRQIINAGQIDNTGLEIALNGTLVKTKNFRWKAFSTFSTNKNKIVSMADQDSTVILRTGAVGGMQIVAKVGGSMGDMYGIGFQRSPDGQVIYDATSGLAQMTTEPIYLGNTVPRYRASIGSEFTFKQFRLNVLFDGQQGAVGHSYTHGRLADFGKLTATLPGRYSGIIGNGVVRNLDGTFSPNTTITKDITPFYNYTMGTANGEGATYKTDFIKFREARLDYSLPKSVLAPLKLSRATIGIYGRNLFIWSTWPMFDPEFGTLSGTDIVQGLEVGQFPSTRTYGFNLVVGFK